MSHKNTNDLGASLDVRPTSTNSDPEVAAPAKYDVQLALSAERRESEMKFSEVLKADLRTIMYALCFSGTIIMEGYGLCLITLFFSYPAFKAKFGVADESGNYAIDYKWQALFPVLAQIGSLIGVAIVPPCTAHLGYKRTVLIMLALSAAFVCLPFFATNTGMLAGAFLLQGVPWGVFQVVSPAYASELASLQLRPIMTTWNNLCWVIGQFLASGITKAFQPRPDEWGFRIPFAFEWIFTTIVLVAITFAPESPYWHLQHGRVDEAKKTLVKFVRKGSMEPADEKYAFMQHTLEQERKNRDKERVSGFRAWIDIFRGTDRRRTEIASVTWLIQAVCGSSIIGWAPTLFQSAGLSVSDSYSVNMAVPAAGAIGTIASWFLMQRASGRQIYFWGLLSMAVSLVIFGCASILSDKSAGWMAGGVLCVFTLLYDLTVGPICYSLVSEMPSIRRRAATLSAARGVYLAINLVNMFINPLMFKTSKEGGWNWGVKTGFFYAGLCLLGAIYTFFRTPNTKGISARGLDILFQNKVSARKFNSTRAALLDENDNTTQGGTAPRVVRSSDSSMDKARVTEKA